MDSEKNPIDAGEAPPVKVGAQQDRKSSATAEKIVQHSHDADEAMKAFVSNEGPIEIDAATNRRILRRIDLNLIPLMCIVYGINYLDKTTISYASIMGIKKDRLVLSSS